LAENKDLAKKLRQPYLIDQHVEMKFVEGLSKKRKTLEILDGETGSWGCGRFITWRGGKMVDSCRG